VKQNQKIPPGSLAVGAPARAIRKLSEEDISNIGKYAERYVALQTRYRNGGLKEI
jgi:carbonic anhydrase/acetyltransferase-like protein (isoleucine patch superfamily)